MAPGPKRRGAKRVGNQSATAKNPSYHKDLYQHDRQSSESPCEISQSETKPHGKDYKVSQDGRTEEKVNTDTNENKKYGKRNIRSNWDRYTEESPETQQSSRAADFQTLLNSSGGIGSQFSFQEEKEWAEVIRDSKDEDFLALDSNELAKAIQCIPAHIRLGIDTDDFKEDMIMHFEDVARMHLKDYTGTKKWPFLKFDVEEQGIPQPSPREKKMVPDEHRATSKVKEQQQNKSIPPKDVINSLVTSISVSETHTITETPKEVGTLEISSDSRKDELDFLLSLGTVPQNKKPLIDISTDSKLQEQEKNVPSHVFKQNDPKSDSSLDEWLDSVLES